MSENALMFNAQLWAAWYWRHIGHEVYVGHGRSIFASGDCVYWGA